MKIDIDARIRLNLNRMIEESGLSQRQFALKNHMDPVLLNQILQNVRCMGKKLMTRVCETMDIDPVQFYLSKDMEIVRKKRQ